MLFIDVVINVAIYIYVESNTKQGKGGILIVRSISEIKISGNRVIKLSGIISLSNNTVESGFRETWLQALLPNLSKHSLQVILGCPSTPA